MKTTHLSLCGLLFVLAACGERAATEAPKSDSGASNPPPATNRVDVPPAVRRNLGITFATAQMRRVTNTIRVPGSFEILRDAHVAYSSTLSGHVELLVKEHQDIEKGTPLFRVKSPEWRDMQMKLARTIVSIRQAKVQLDALEPRVKAAALHAKQLEAQKTVWKERLAQIEALRAAGGGVASARTEARAQLAEIETSLAEAAKASAAIQSERQTTSATLHGFRETSPLLYAEALGESAGEHGADAPGVDLALVRAATLLGVSVERLRENVGSPAQPVPYWRSVEYVEVRALADGHVEHLGVVNGAWVDPGGLVLETVDPRQLRFRAAGLQADLGRLRNGMTAVVVPPNDVTAPGLHGTVRIGVSADPAARKIDLLIALEDDDLPHWARNGVSADVEIQVRTTKDARLSVPERSVIRDGLQRVLFRRDPKDPNKVIRLNADLGPSDGRWIIVESGLMEGDEVVLDGVYELMLASGANTKLKGGHFHADGTWHADDH